VRAGAQDAPEGSAARREAEAVAAESAALKAELELPLLPVLNNSAPDRGNVAVLQLVVTPPFELQLVFLQQECFSSAGAASSVSDRAGVAVGGAGASKATAGIGSDNLQSQGRQLEPALAAAFANAAADPIRRIKTRTWRQLAESLGFASLDSTHSIAETRRRQYHEDLCARLRICVDSAHLQHNNSNSTAAGGGSAGHGYVAGPAAAAQRNRSAEAVTPQLVASRAIANLVGSITHFHGTQLVADAFPLDGDTGRTLPAARQTAPGHLLSGVPSRSFFPRGFLWDEGFHQLIVSQVNPPLSRRVLRSWLHSMEGDGWIPREQILGGEARSRVPERFRVQHRDIANPPAIALPVLALAADTFCRRPPHAWTAQATRDASAAPRAAATPAGEGAAVEASTGGPAAEVVAEVLVLPGGEVAATLPDGIAVNNGSAGVSPHVSVTLAPFLPAGVLRFCESRYLHVPPSQQVAREGADATSGTGAQRCKYACSLPEVAPAAQRASIGASTGRHADALGLEEDADDAAGDDAAALAAASGDDDDDDGLGDDLSETDSGAAQQRRVHAQVQRALSFYRMAYRRLSLHYAWMRRSQAGAQPGSFRWRGATQDHNFASGLDDYPRGDVPTAADENVDLLAWVAFFAEALADLGGLVDAPATELAAHRADAAAAVERLHSRHWSAEHKAFCDIGARVQPGRRAAGEPVPVAMGLLCHVGYVSLVPLMLRHVDPADSARLGALLSVMEDEGQLWSSYGLRSLSRASEHYATKEDYWRQAVWLNMNYLSVAALRYYAAASPDAVIAARARALAGRLADALVGTVVGEYAATGFLWENYDSRTGKGRGTHPFTGWTALVALMIADRYPV
jgi:hypothetical protein